MEKISVLIVEDVSLVAEDIASKLTKHHMEVAGIYDNGEDAIRSLEEKIPDLILMDIQLAGAYDGISTAQIINQSNAMPIIYLTDHTHDKKAFDRAKKTLPAGYLSKPFNEIDLINAIEIAINNWQAKGDSSSVLRNHIFIKDDQSHVKLSYNDIIYLKADRAYCNIVTENKTYVQSSNMSHILDQIRHRDFVRIHRSHVVNVNKITEIEGNIIKLGKHQVEMSNGMRDELIGKLKFLK